MTKEIEFVSGNMGSPLENFGLANFIQVYIDSKPYFRYNAKKHFELLEELLTEFDLPFDILEKNDLNERFPKPRGRNYSLVGEGQINEACRIKKDNVDELGSMEYYAIFPSQSDYNLFPSISHLKKVLDYFDKPIIFASQEYQTEEQKGFLNWNPCELNWNPWEEKDSDDYGSL